MKNLLLISFVVFISSCFQTRLTEYINSEETVIYLFRHAEKEKGKDPALTSEGKARAGDLKNVLMESKLTHIFSSDYLRTRQTVEPLDNIFEAEVELYDPRNLTAFAEKLKGLRGNIAVSGHSNTTPELVKLLGGEAGIPIGEKWEFDRLYVLILKDGIVLKTIQLKYGELCKPLPN